MKKNLIALAAMAACGVAVGAGIPASAYVQEGLVTQFDAIDNVGTGVHDPTATVWRDLKGSASVTLKGNAAWHDRYLDSTPTSHALTSMPSYLRRSMACEVAINVISNGVSGQYPRIFAHAEAFSIYYNGAGTSAYLYINNIDGDPRPNAGTFRNGTIAALSDSTNFRIAVDGVTKATAGKAVPATEAVKPSANWTLNGYNGYLHGYYRAFRFYNRALTPGELRWNMLVDQARLFPYEWTGPASKGEWSAAENWTAPYGYAAGVPASSTNNAVEIRNASVKVPASRKIGVLALETATLDLAADVVLEAQLAFTNGAPVARGIYTGAGGTGAMVVDWVSGTGLVRVSGDPSSPMPEVLVTAGADGWCEFGDDYTGVTWGTDPATSGFGQAKGPLDPANSKQYVHAKLVDWGKLAFPVGAKLRLKNGVVMNTLLVAWFDEIDISKLKRLVVYTDRVFSDGRKLTVPSGCSFRWQPCTWKEDTSAAVCWMLSGQPTWTTRKYEDPIELNGELHHRGDGTHMNPEWFTCPFSGTGKVVATSFSNQILFNGDEFNFNGTLQCSSNGTAIDIEAESVSGEIQSVSLYACVDQPKYQTNVNYCASGILFRPKTTNRTTQGELLIKTLTGNASDYTDLQGKRWRNGGHIVVWGDNTVHARTLKKALHVVATKSDHQCVNNRFNANGYGIGHFIVDDVATDVDNLFLSTNVTALVGKVNGATCFNYTYQSNAVNRMTLDITNSCATSASLRATDLQMLPARVSGFTGTVALRDVAAAKFQNATYAMTVDFDKELYTTDGCIGSGTLSAAPASGTVNVTLAGTPKKGEYSLFRFGSAVGAGGQPLFANWAVNVVGHEGENQFTVGSGENMKVVTVKKDATGLWLKVSNPGLQIFLR